MSHPELITALTSLAAGLAAGLVMHRSGFCMAGMFRDLFMFRSVFMLRVLAAAVAVAMLLLELLRQTGLVAVFPFPGFNTPSLATIAGGVLFGVGMVLAGGCVAGTLYRIGAGSSASMVAFGGLLAGSALYAEFHGFWAPVAAKTKLPAGFETIAGLLGISQGGIVMLSLAILAIPVYGWIRKGMLLRSAFVGGYVQPWIAAVVLAGAVALSVAVIGVPLGVTTSYAKMGAWIEHLVAPEHVSSLSYFQLIPFKYDNVLLGITYRGGPGPQADSISLIQFPLIVGLMLGGFVSAILAREFRVRAAPPVQLLSAAIGGVLMGLAARMAPSCNLWHLLGGLPILATQSVLFMVGLLPGAWLGSLVLEKIVMSETFQKE